MDSNTLSTDQRDTRVDRIHHLVIRKLALNHFPLTSLNIRNNSSITITTTIIIINRNHSKRHLYTLDGLSHTKSEVDLSVLKSCI